MFSISKLKEKECYFKGYIKIDFYCKESFVFALIYWQGRQSCSFLKAFVSLENDTNKYFEKQYSMITLLAAYDKMKNNPLQIKLLLIYLVQKNIKKFKQKCILYLEK